MPLPPHSLIDALSRPGTILLDTARQDAESRRSLLFTDPLQVLTAHTPQDVLGLLDGLDARVEEGLYVAGYLAYEAGYAFEDVATPAGKGPLAWFGVYEAPVVLEEPAVTGLLAGYAGAPFAVRDVHLTIPLATYLDRIARVKTYIHDGDVYQINFTDKVVFGFEGSPVAFYHALRRRQRTAFGAYLQTGATHLLCLSPELFFRRHGSRVWTRPMKGTVHRGHTLGEDQALQRWLAADPKSRAENLMIVDLLRNDLARCCRPGSVQVRDLFATEVYETLIQMTSTVEGDLRGGVRYADLFRALFPCGSVTGAPKIRAMQRIHELEAGPRGVYCGAIGYIAPDDRAAFNVAIRTIVLRDGHGVMGTGSGIVWDSDPRAEYDECRLKAHFLVQTAQPEPNTEEDFQLIETMRAEAGVIERLALHIDRLRASAQYFGFVFDEAAVRARIEAELLKANGMRCKVRITLGRDGGLSVTATALPAQPARYRRVVFSEVRIDSDDAFFYHKTTRRQPYEDAYRRARARGFDEVLFLNERGEVTEGSRTNVFVRQGDVFYTPPVACGLLGGIYRRHLLLTMPAAAVRVLWPEDLRGADAVYLCNAVQGFQEVEVLSSPAPFLVQPEPDPWENSR